MIEFDDNKILISALYGPNEDSPDFYKYKVFNRIDLWQPVYGGDWNLVLDQKLDTKNYIHENNLQAKTELINKMEYYSLIDVWRKLNPSSKKFTRTGKTSRPYKLSRLDFFLITNSLFPFIKSAKIEAGILSDHSIISLEIDFRNFTRGRGYWKFNNSLLRDETYVEKVKSVLKM